jgi:hypothetical protein
MSAKMGQFLGRPADRPPRRKSMLEELKAMGSPRMLELGTRRSDPNVSTVHRDYYPFAGEYIGTDIQPGLDVDIISDVHSLSKTFGEGNCSPWGAADLVSEWRQAAKCS